MDPLAHTLVGACLAETGLRRWTPYATVTLIVGANLPDIDAIAQLAGMDASLDHRRGWTHGVLAMAVLPLLLAGFVTWLDRRREIPAGARPGPLLLLSYLSVLSHPALDLLNTYGVRLLMPFDGRWFYGDVLFIVDPWMWLLMGAPVVLARSTTRRALVNWSVLGGLTLLVALTAPVPAVARILFAATLATIVLARYRDGSRARPALARLAIATLGAYIACMLVGREVAARAATDWLAQQGVDGQVVMAGPLPATPFARDVVAVQDRRYHFVRADLLGVERLRYSHPPLPMGDLGSIGEAGCVRGFLNWMRFPSVSMEPTPDGAKVLIRDVRYARDDRDDGFGVAAFETPCD